MVDFLAQAIFHTFVAAITVAALLRLWRVHEPSWRLAFRVLPLLVPVLVLPVFSLGWPERQEPRFAAEWALFVGARWDDVAPFGVSMFALWLWALAALGTVLFLLDLVPLVADRVRGRHLGRVAGHAPDERLALSVAEASAVMQITPPHVVLVDDARPLLMCAGVRRPTLLASRGTLAALDDAELRAAVAHELSHILRRDTGASWVLMGARAVMFFNPVFQVVARVVAHEAEWRADDDAVAATHEPLALASALLKLYRASETHRDGRLRAALARARAAAITTRCRRLLDAPSPKAPTLAAARLALSGMSISLLLFFVV